MIVGGFKNDVKEEFFCDIVKLFMIKRIFFFILLIGFFLLPLVYWPLSPIPYEIPKVIFFQYWLEIILILCLLFFFKIFSHRKIDPTIIILIIFFLISNLISSFIGVDFFKKFLGKLLPERRNFYPSSFNWINFYFSFILERFFQSGFKQNYYSGKFFDRNMDHLFYDQASFPGKSIFSSFRKSQFPRRLSSCHPPFFIIYYQ